MNNRVEFLLPPEARTTNTLTDTKHSCDTRTSPYDTYDKWNQESHAERLRKKQEESVRPIFLSWRRETEQTRPMGNVGQKYKENRDSGRERKGREMHDNLPLVGACEIDTDDQASFADSSILELAHQLIQAAQPAKKRSESSWHHFQVSAMRNDGKEDETRRSIQVGAVT